jgi:hypothetical protein
MICKKARGEAAAQRKAGLAERAELAGLAGQARERVSAAAPQAKGVLRSC